jgi:hypothetical protein
MTIGKEFKKFINESLGFLDIAWIRYLIMIILILYIIGAIPLFTEEIAEIFHNPLIKILFILLIIYIGFKDLVLAILLAIAFVLSLQVGYKFRFGTHFGISPQGVAAGAEAGINDDAKIELKAHLGDNVEGMKSSESPDGYNYNNYFDCVKECADDDLGTGDLDSPCKGVGVWKKELNAQGLNCPLGYSGSKDGSPF